MIKTATLHKQRIRSFPTYAALLATFRYYLFPQMHPQHSICGGPYLYVLSFVSQAGLCGREQVVNRLQGNMGDTQKQEANQSVHLTKRRCR